jgi:hypothetical protein
MTTQTTAIISLKVSIPLKIVIRKPKLLQAPKLINMSESGVPVSFHF